VECGTNQKRSGTGEARRTRRGLTKQKRWANGPLNGTWDLVKLGGKVAKILWGTETQANEPNKMGKKKRQRNRKTSAQLIMNKTKGNSRVMISGRQETVHSGSGGGVGAHKKSQNTKRDAMLVRERADLLQTDRNLRGWR